MFPMHSQRHVHVAPANRLTPVHMIWMPLIHQMVNILRGIVHHTARILKQGDQTQLELRKLELLTFIHPAGAMK